MSSHCADRQACTQRETYSCCRIHRLLHLFLLTSSAACPGMLQTAMRKQKAANSSPLLLTGPRITSILPARASCKAASLISCATFGLIYIMHKRCR
jgi:hypothetical protein